ncbi:tyrosine-type recombinase/integrase [Methanobrevibacter thaueri]|uniref:Phage integrase family protein n=1 Tax=Methanobrevibacter thaueri TaxID=190975 RepID=A0A315XNJ1_9EURY|nr:tyrosine-type recombinase/integrase [Methanobrevibacter thaueri]PWB87895.1 phage integrase family protein [Methanobrevibacter thaueri]
MNKEYDVRNDEYYQLFISDSLRNETTAEKYFDILTKFCEATNKTLGEIIADCTDEQNIVTKEKLPPDENGNERIREIRFDVNNKDSKINKYLNQFVDYCRQRNNKNVTINGQRSLIIAFLREFGVLIPKIKKLEDDSDDWYLLTKEDYNYLLQDMSLVHISLANFLTSTGMRIGDALSLSISDFMKATEEYHDFVDVEDFIDNAPEDMIGQWVFEPHKTERHGVKCITFNSTHSSNLILQYLRHIKNQYLPNKNKKRNEDSKLKISKKWALFGSRREEYVNPMKPTSVATQWGEKNKKFHLWKENQIKQQIADGKISEEDFTDELLKIPRFHPHTCRKYFISTVAKNCGDIRVCALLEGHSDGLPNDKSYVKKKVKEIKEIYINNIHDALSLDNVETKIVTNKETEELNKKVSEADKKIEALTNQNAEKDKKIEELTKLINQTQEQVDNLSFNRNRSNIQKIIFEYFDNNYKENILNQEEDVSIGRKKCSILCKLAYEFAIENESNFRNDDVYLNSLIQKSIVKYTLNPEIELFDKKELTPDEVEFVTKHLTLQFELFELIKSNDTLWNMVKDDEVTLNNIILYIIKKNKDNIDNLTDEDKDNMVQDVLMEYLTVD